MSAFTRKVSFAAAYDQRDPNPLKNYGIHGVHITFLVSRDGEGLTFGVSTNWRLPHVQAETDAIPGPDWDPHFHYRPTGFDVCMHRKTPAYEGQTPVKSCTITGGACYGDGSALLGDSFLQTLIEGGDEALFARMEKQFEDWSTR